MLCDKIVLIWKVVFLLKSHPRALITASKEIWHFLLLVMKVWPYFDHIHLEISNMQRKKKGKKKENVKGILCVWLVEVMVPIYDKNTSFNRSNKPMDINWAGPGSLGGCRLLNWATQFAFGFWADLCFSFLFFSIMYLCKTMAMLIVSLFTSDKC